MLSDAYGPTIENSNDATLQYVVTDGKSFAALQQRDMTYTVSSPDPSGMVCEVTSTDAAHGFKLVTDYLTDPGQARPAWSCGPACWHCTATGPRWPA